MHIAYIISEDVSVASGVLKKVEAKIRYWKKYGHKVSLISLKSTSMTALVDDAIILSQYVKEKNFRKKFLRRITISVKLDQCLYNLQPDVIYTRYTAMPDLVHIFKKHAPYIVEINTNDVTELKNGKVSRYIFNLLTRSYFLSNAEGFVSVSKELMLNKVFIKFKKKFIVIGNGYDFNSVSNWKSSFHDKLKFIFIGSPKQPWHGTDKIIILAKKLRKYEFHIVGPTKKDFNLNENFENNIIFHGYRDSNYLKKLIPECDIGISSLALHRNDMEEASPLKSREYLAYGLPIIIGYDDTDLPVDFEYLLNIGNYEDNVKDHFDQIERFANKFKNINPMEIRKNSEKYIDYQTKEKLRLNFIQQIINKEY